MAAANVTTRPQAPKGGISIMGVFYKGGQFLPDFAPAEESSKSKRSSVKVSEFEVEVARLENYVAIKSNSPAWYNAQNLLSGIRSARKLTDGDKRRYVKSIRMWVPAA